MKNYYSILGISVQALPEEIKKAYRKLAKEFHPDINLNNAFSEARFKEINEANAVLSDVNKRRLYDLKLKEYYNQINQNAGQQLYKPQTSLVKVGVTIFIVLGIVFLVDALSKEQGKYKPATY